MNRLVIKMISVMVIITAVSGLVLSGIWSVSVDKIQKNEVIKIEQALREITPGTVTYKIVDVEGEQVYKCLDEQGLLLSYFFLAVGNGFQAPIKVAVAVNPAKTKLLGLRVLEQSETPGLGNKIVEPSFTSKFADLLLQKEPVFSCIKESASKSKGEIQAITGATISSKAIVTILNLKIDALRKAGL